MNITDFLVDLFLEATLQLQLLRVRIQEFNNPTLTPSQIDFIACVSALGSKNYQRWSDTASPYERHVYNKIYRLDETRCILICGRISQRTPYFIKMLAGYANILIHPPRLIWTSQGDQFIPPKPVSDRAEIFHFLPLNRTTPEPVPLLDPPPDRAS
jgi:hypothetical protein